MTTIYFIGLGKSGAPMAANLVKAGHKVIGLDLGPALHAASKWLDEQGVDMITGMALSPAALSVRHIAQRRGKINTYTEAVATTTVIPRRGGDRWALIVADCAFGVCDIQAIAAASAPWSRRRADG